MKILTVVSLASILLLVVAISETQGEVRRLVKDKTDLEHRVFMLEADNKAELAELGKVTDALDALATATSHAFQAHSQELDMVKQSLHYHNQVLKDIREFDGEAVTIFEKLAGLQGVPR